VVLKRRNYVWRDRHGPTAGVRLDATSEPQTIWRPSSTGASQSWRRSIQVRCPGFRAFQKRSMTIPSGGPTWQSDPSLSPISPTRSKITSAKVTARRPGLQQEVIPPHLFAKSPCGEPPTASIPKIRDQPAEEASLISRRPLETATRPAYRPFHRFARQREV
jgi:hypothetical protein